MLYDKDIREPLFEFLEELYAVNRIIEEKQMGRSRADVLMVTPQAIYGIEIKSDADSYTRLARQVRDYNLFYDYNYIVVGTKHAHHIGEHVPEWWGIITVEEVDGKADFYLLRKPKNNPKVKWKRKLGMLWRPELAHIQEINGMPKYKQKSKKFVMEKILEKIPEDILQIQFCNELMERDYNLIERIIEAYRREK
ncbi:MAG: sce7726 family protein [Eubacterium sp.]|nr:sce7726 family protein [Eubacterium sp.]